MSECFNNCDFFLRAVALERASFDATCDSED
jgi:hypothetical protein